MAEHPLASRPLLTLTLTLTLPLTLTLTLTLIVTLTLTEHPLAAIQPECEEPPLLVESGRVVPACSRRHDALQRCNAAGA